MRSRTKLSRSIPLTTSTTRPSTSTPTLYSQNSPGWCSSGMLGDGLDHLGERLGGEDGRLAVHLIHGRVSEQAVGQAGGVAHQVLDGHGAFRRRAFGTHLDVFELGQVLRDWRGDVELALFGQDHRGDGGDGLGHGRDAEDGVLLHGRLRGAILEADGVEESDLAVAGDQQHGAGHALGVDVFLEDSLSDFQAFGRESDVFRMGGHRERLGEGRRATEGGGDKDSEARTGHGTSLTRVAVGLGGS